MGHRKHGHYTCGVIFVQKRLSFAPSVLYGSPGLPWIRFPRRYKVDKYIMYSINRGGHHQSNHQTNTRTPAGWLRSDPSSDPPSWPFPRSVLPCLETSGKENTIFVRERNVLFNDTLNTFYLWLYVAAGFLSRYLSGPLPDVWRHITINKMCWVCC